MTRNFIIYACALVLVCIVSEASAQTISIGNSHTRVSESPFHPDDRTPAMIRDLMRVMVSEAGFDDQREWAALGWTIARRVRRLRERRGWTARQTLGRLCTRTLRRPRTRRQRWVHALSLDAIRPVGWSSLTRAVWDPDKAERAVDYATDMVAGRVPDPCDGPSELWGSRRHPVDAARIQRMVAAGRWAIVDCGLDETERDNLYVRWTTRAEMSDHRRSVLPPNLRRVIYIR